MDQTITKPSPDRAEPDAHGPRATQPHDLRFSRLGDGLVSLHAIQELPAPIDHVFAFFSDARNLQRITPPLLDFHILTPDPIDMRAGALIDYRLRIRGVPVRWRTRISSWSPPTSFIDEQIKGPYLLWHHTHTFTPTAAGTLVVDAVRYRVPLGWAVEPWLVRPDLRRIFTYRRDRMAAIFPPS